MKKTYTWGTMEWLAGSELGNASSISLAKMLMQPGETSEAHRHANCEEAILILRGNVEIRLGVEARQWGAGKCVVVPAGEVHCVTNVGEEQAELILSYGAGDREYEACSPRTS